MLTVKWLQLDDGIVFNIFRPARLVDRCVYNYQREKDHCAANFNCSDIVGFHKGHKDDAKGFDEHESMCQKPKAHSGQWQDPVPQVEGPLIGWCSVLPIREGDSSPYHCPLGVAVYTWYNTYWRACPISADVMAFCRPRLWSSPKPSDWCQSRGAWEQDQKEVGAVISYTQTLFLNIKVGRSIVFWVQITIVLTWTFLRCDCILWIRFTSHASGGTVVYLH